MIDGAWKLSNPVLGLVVVALTFLLFYVVGFISNRKAASAKDLYLGGGNVGALTNGLAMAAT